jgi:hypothetical protein
VIKSDALASYLTEVPCAIRTFGRLKAVDVTAASVVVLTGNGVTLSLDHTRRWLPIEFDPRTEFPENRKFASQEKTFADDILCRRKEELLAAVLTIWRWGRTSPSLKQGMPTGSYEKWAAWCRDPLFTLGCPDPIPRLRQEKDRDPERGAIKEVFRSWWQHHHDDFVRVTDLNEAVKLAIAAFDGADPTRALHSRQYLARRVAELAATQIGGFKLVRCSTWAHHRIGATGSLACSKVWGGPSTSRSVSRKLWTSTSSLRRRSDIPAKLEREATLRGRLMRFVYLDEAGISDGEPILVVAGVIINADRDLAAVEDYLLGLAREYLPDENPYRIAFHAKDIWHGHGLFPRDKWPREDATRYYRSWRTSRRSSGCQSWLGR